MPPGVLAMLRIPGLGPKKAAALYKELGIDSLDELRAACEADEVQQAQRLRREDGGEDSGRHRPRRRRPTSGCTGPRPTRSSRSCSPTCASCKGIRQIEVGRQLSPRQGNDRRPRPAGRRRRRRRRDGPSRRSSSDVATVIGRGDTKMSIRLGRGLQVDLRVVPAEVVRRGAAILHRLEGPQRHPPRHGQGPRAEDQRVRRLPRRSKKSRSDDGRTTRRELHRRPHGGRSLRRARPALLPAGDSRGPRRSSTGPPPASCRSSSSSPTSRRPAHAHHRERRQGDARGNGRRRPGARPQVHRHHRPLEARQHGQRPRPGAAPRAVGRNRPAQPRARRLHRAQGHRVRHPRKGRHGPARRRAGRGRLGRRQRPLRPATSRASRSPTASSARSRIRTSRSSPIRRAG